MYRVCLNKSDTMEPFTVTAIVLSQARVCNLKSEARKTQNILFKCTKLLISSYILVVEG